MPGPAERIHLRPARYPYAPEAAHTAAEAWRSLASVLAGTPHLRTSRDGRRYPARYARPLPPESAVIPVYDLASATGRMLALDLDAARAADVDDGPVCHGNPRPVKLQRSRPGS